MIIHDAEGPSWFMKTCDFSGLEFWRGAWGDMILEIFAGFWGASSDIPGPGGIRVPGTGARLFVSFLVCYEVMRGGWRAGVLGIGYEDLVRKQLWYEILVRGSGTKAIMVRNSGTRIWYEIPS